MAHEADRDEQFDRLRAAASEDAVGVVSKDALPSPDATDEEDADEDVAPDTGAQPAVYRRAVVSGPHRLRFPFDLAGQTVSSISFCEPSFGDIEDVTTGRISELDLHARMAGVSTDVLRALKWSDSEMASTIARLVAPQLRRK